MFPSNLNSLGILCRGSSLMDLPKIEKYFDKCFIVNNFEREAYHFKEILKKKEIIHFVNRSSYTVLKKKTYKFFNINSIQMAAPFNLFDKNLMISFLIYKFFSLNVSTMPKYILHKFDYTGNKAYKNKFPNTGILSILYAAEILKVKNLYIIGLDFFTNDYFFKNEFSKGVASNYKKFVDLKIFEYFLEFINKNADTKFFLKTNYKFKVKPDNLILI